MVRLRRIISWVTWSLWGEMRGIALVPHKVILLFEPVRLREGE